MSAFKWRTCHTIHVESIGDRMLQAYQQCLQFSYLQKLELVICLLFSSVTPFAITGKDRCRGSQVSNTAAHI